MKILVMGFPGSGKTFMAERLQKNLNCTLYNSYKIREATDNWDFSNDGHLRLAEHMRLLANFEKKNGRTVICDFVCPTQTTRHVFGADYLIWMNTITRSKYEDTNNMFEIPAYADLVIENFLTDDQIKIVSDKIKRALSSIR